MLQRRNLYYSSLLAVILTFGCGSERTDQEEPLPNIRWSLASVSEDVLIGRFAHLMSMDTLDKSAVLTNELLNYLLSMKWDLQRTDSGLYYQILEPGSEDKPMWGDRATVHYNGYLTDGKMFDSSHQRNKAFSFYIGNVIAGWNEALPLIGAGGKMVIIVPTHLAYGEAGFGKLVKPDQHLIFEMELIDFEKP